VTVKGVKYIGYQPFIAETNKGQMLIQVFTNMDTGLIETVHLAHRLDAGHSWGPPIRFEKA
jgi:hypothetical protein